MWNNGQQQGTWWPNYNFQYQANMEGKYFSFGSLSSQGRLCYTVFYKKQLIRNDTLIFSRVMKQPYLILKAKKLLYIQLIFSNLFKIFGHSKVFIAIVWTSFWVWTMLFSGLESLLCDLGALRQNYCKWTLHFRHQNYKRHGIW